MKDTLSLEQRAKKNLEEREKCCTFCGFRYDDRTEKLYGDCLFNECNYLIKEIKLLQGELVK